MATASQAHAVPSRAPAHPGPRWRHRTAVPVRRGLGLEADALSSEAVTKNTAGREDEPVEGGRCTVEGPRTAARERNPRQDRAHAPTPRPLTTHVSSPPPPCGGGVGATRRFRSGGEFQGLCRARGVSGPLPARCQGPREARACILQARTNKTLIQLPPAESEGPLR